MISTLLNKGIPVPAFPPFYGVRRPLSCPPPLRYSFTTEDGVSLQVHNIPGGSKGPVIIAPGTAMTALSFLTDTTDQSFAEFLSAEGFDVWLFDWRTSPCLESHKSAYTFEDVAKNDWPAVITFVREQTGATQVSVLAHCLSSPSLMLSLLRGYTDPKQIKAFIPSQVGLHLVMNKTNRFKAGLRIDKLLPANRMVHMKHDLPRRGIWDFAVGILARVMPKSCRCNNRSCYRQRGTFGELIFHGKINNATHNLMGDMIPVVNSTFLKDVAPRTRAKDIMTDEDRKHLSRLNVPMLLISGEMNQMLVPESTARTWKLLHDALGEKIQRRVFEGFGHLDFYISGEAREPIWRPLAKFLEG